jgi:hypothetical protein
MSDSLDHAGFVAPSAADLAPLFPGYEIHGLIASGGMGAVYSAVQRSLDRTVAIKILPMELSKDAAFCAGFEAEAKAMARLNHPNLIGVYDFGEVNGMLYIIMEFVPGKSIYHSAYGIAIDQMEVIRLVTGICNGLAHAHEHGIIHRDIKPSNILLDLHAQPKIGDFGLARPVERKIEEGEEIFGTPHYTAPEVVNAPHTVDHRADIFSVGVLIHELLTSKLPANDPRPASTIVHCDPRFDTIIRRATSPHPASRYSSAKEIAHDLQAIAASLVPKVPRTAVVAAPRPAVPVRGRQPIRAKKSSNAPTFIMLLLVAGGAIAAFTFLKPGESKTSPPPVVINVPAPVAPKKEDPPAEPDGKDTIPPVAADPTTTPVPEPTPDPATEPDATAETTTPDEPAIAEPKFDVPAFLARARKIMQDKAKSSVSTYRSNLSSNLADFEKSLKRQARKVKTDGDAVEQAVEGAVAEWKAAGSRIPENLDSTIDALPEVQSIYALSLQKQVGVDDTFHQGLAPLAATYVVGLEKQIDRLKADNDTGAIALLEAEIARTRKSTKYFADLMLGVEPEEE